MVGRDFKREEALDLTVATVGGFFVCVGSTTLLVAAIKSVGLVALLVPIAIATLIYGTYRFWLWRLR